MFALFLVLWLLTQADLKLRQELARYFRNAGVQSGGSMLGDKLEEARTNQTKPLEAALTIVQGSGEELRRSAGRRNRSRKRSRRAPSSTPSKITSASRYLSSAALKPELVSLLRELAGHLKALPNHIEIGGHTDARPFAATAGLSNWDLSFQRANNARAVLEQSGIRPNQILRISAYGSEKPLNVANPLADENRRLSILARREKKDAAEAQGPASVGFGGQPVTPPIVAPGTPPV
jgi:chemotaxis protein MotB